MPKYFRDQLTHNAIACLKCGEVIESKHRHDFKWCGCGACAVDGGLEYERRLGDFESMQDLSTYKQVPEPACECIEVPKYAFKYCFTCGGRRE